MIVLDEHLQSKGVEEAIRRWYAGAVINILDLRPDTVIKDEAIPKLLAQQNQPMFVTINVIDFWQRMPASDRFCFVFFAMTSSEILQIPYLLQRLLRHADFDSKAKRAGTAIRITAQGNTSYYSASSSVVHLLADY